MFRWEPGVPIRAKTAQRPLNLMIYIHDYRTPASHEMVV